MRKSNTQRASSASAAFARPKVACRPCVKHRRVNPDGTVTVIRKETDARGVTRRYETTIVPN